MLVTKLKNPPISEDVNEFIPTTVKIDLDSHRNACYYFTYWNQFLFQTNVYIV